MTPAKRELDHIFLFVKNKAKAAQMLQDAGLRVNYGRQHPGQGTSNLCACLDDMFIELIWADGTDISAESDRISLGARCRGEGAPLGISWRGISPKGCATYAAPFLPNGVSIPVLAESLSPAMPFIFQTPGGAPPIERDPDLVGNRQHPRLARMGTCTLWLQDRQAADL